MLIGRLHSSRGLEPGEVPRCLESGSARLARGCRLESMEDALAQEGKARAPAGRLKIRYGARPSATAKPVAAGEWVCTRMSSGKANCEMPVPTEETACPPHSQR